MKKVYVPVTETEHYGPMVVLLTILDQTMIHQLCSFFFFFFAKSSAVFFFRPYRYFIFVVHFQKEHKDWFYPCNLTKLDRVWVMYNYIQHSLKKRLSCEY